MLEQKSDGFVYLKVDDRYIHELFPMLALKEYGFRKPPYERGPGAHISVFYVDEHIHPKEIGQTFHFKLKKNCFCSYFKGHLCSFPSRCSDLEKLRLKYGLKPKIHGKEFHISLAKKNSR